MYTLCICLIAGIGAGLGTGFAGISAATVISPLLIVMLGVEPYQAVGIALASDVLASAVSACTYARSKNIDLKHGSIMLGSVLILTIIGSFLASYMPAVTMGYFSTVITACMGLNFLLRPNTNTKESQQHKTLKRRIVESLVCGIYIGFVCGFIGAGGGLMMLFVLTSILNYDLKTAVGTSVFVMTFTALIGAGSHMLIGGIGDVKILLFCVLFTLIFARIGAVIANRVSAVTLNRLTGLILAATGISMTLIRFVSNMH